MQLAKHNWKKSRNTARFTQPARADGAFLTRRGRMISYTEKEQQIASRHGNPQDPINRN